MIDRLTPHYDTLLVRTVESAGITFTVAAADVVDVLPLEADAVMHLGTLSSMPIDNGRLRPLVSLREVLCLPTDEAAGAEDVVVVMQIAGQLFGLTVERVGEPVTAPVHPTFAPAPAMMTFNNIVQLGPHTALPVLNPVRLALPLIPASAQPAQQNLRLVA